MPLERWPGYSLCSGMPPWKMSISPLLCLLQTKTQQKTEQPTISDELVLTGKQICISPMTFENYKSEPLSKTFYSFLLVLGLALKIPSSTRVNEPAIIWTKQAAMWGICSLISFNTMQSKYSSGCIVMEKLQKATTILSPFIFILYASDFQDSSEILRRLCSASVMDKTLSIGNWSTILWHGVGTIIPSISAQQSGVQPSVLSAASEPVTQRN